MILVLYLILVAVPLLGVAFILIYGSVTTVDGLFASIIMLTISGIVGLGAWLELRSRGVEARASSGRVALASGALRQRGRVQSVQFFESDVGQPNKSIVLLADGAKAAQMMVFEGDMRNALPVGQKVEITFRKQKGLSVLVNVNYA